ncbi:MAG: eL32 family ribosomal protein [Candidatus Micrarchaeia archaeon]
MRKHPKFLPPNYGRKKRVKLRWRKPRGIDNKKRIGKKIMGASPNVGWRSARDDRDFHPSGFKEILVRSLKDMDGITEKGVAIRIAAAVGAKKRELIIKKAKEMNIHVLNPVSVKHQKQ